MSVMDWREGSKKYVPFPVGFANSASASGSRLKKVDVLLSEVSVHLCDSSVQVISLSFSLAYACVCVSAYTCVSMHGRERLLSVLSLNHSSSYFFNWLFFILQKNSDILYNIFQSYPSIPHPRCLFPCLPLNFISFLLVVTFQVQLELLMFVGI